MNLLASQAPLLDTLLGDTEIAALLSPEAELTQMLAFERALLIAEQEAGLLPAGTSAVVLPLLATFEPDIDALRQEAARNGVVAVEFVRQLRAHVGRSHDRGIHFGATSQDIVDTALVLRLRTILDIVETRVLAILRAITDLDARFGTSALMGRTRLQDALPITVADRLATWRLPLERHLERLAELRPRLLVVQFGGAVGTLDVVGEKVVAVTARLAAQLDLAVPPRAWHNQRDAIVELGGWLALVTGSLGKIGADIGLMAQNAIAEIAIAGGGASSAMPHKANPVGAEVLVALAHANAAYAGGLQLAMLHEQERSGAAWTLEWLLLPQMLVTTGASLRTALALLENVTRIGVL